MVTTHVAAGMGVPTGGAGVLRLFRAVSPAEFVDVTRTGALRPAAPSFQGKWFAESVADAARWGRRLHRQTGIPFHIIEVEVDEGVADLWYRLPFLDRIGPARFAEIADLGQIRFLREVPFIPLRPP